MVHARQAPGKTRFYVPFILAFLVFSAVLAAEYAIVQQMVEDAYRAQEYRIQALFRGYISIMEGSGQVTSEDAIDIALLLSQPLKQPDPIFLHAGILHDTSDYEGYSDFQGTLSRTSSSNGLNRAIVHTAQVKMQNGEIAELYLIKENDKQIKFMEDIQIGMIIILGVMVIFALVPGGLMIESFWRRRRMAGPVVGSGLSQVRDAILGSFAESGNVGVMVVGPGQEIIQANPFCRELLEMSESDPVSSLASVMALPESVRQDVTRGRAAHLAEQITLKSMTGESRTVVMERFQAEGSEPGDLVVLLFVPALYSSRSGYSEGNEESSVSEKILRSDTELLGSILHRMRNHLSGIIGTVSVEMDQADGAGTSAGLASIMDSAGRLTSLCGDIESIVRNESASELRDPLEEVGLIAGILKRVLPRNVSFQLSGRSSKLISVPRELLREFLYSLALNSVETMNREGRIRIDVSDRIPSELSGISSVSPDSMVAIRYSDGFIMPVALRDVLSSGKYSLGDVERQFGSTLGSLYRVVREMNGRIVFERGSGETVMCLLLSGSEAEGGDEVKAVDPQEAQREIGSLRVLVADEEKIVLKSTCDYLEHRGMSVTPVSDGTRAMEMLRSMEFDVAVLDLNMPGTPTEGIVRFCQTRLPQMAVVITTGYGITGTVRELIEFPSTFCISKPHKPELLVETIYSTLARTREGGSP